MKTSELEALVNTLCLSAEYGRLYRILKPFDGAYQILSSDQPAEQKRRQLLNLIRGNHENGGTDL